MKKFNSAIVLMLLLNALAMPVMSIQATEQTGEVGEEVIGVEGAGTELPVQSDGADAVEPPKTETETEIAAPEEVVTEPTTTPVEEAVAEETLPSEKIYAGIVSEEKVEENFIIKDVPYFIYSAPFGTEGAERVERVRDYAKRNNHNAFLSKKVVTSEGVEVYEIPEVGWVDARSFEAYPAYTITDMNQDMKITRQNYYVYTAPYGTYGATRVHRLSAQVPLTGLDVLVTKAAVGENGVKIYYVEGVGWFDQRAVTPYQTVAAEVEIQTYMKFDQLNYYVYNKPYGTVGSQRVRSVKEQVALTGVDVFVEKQATTSAGVVVYLLKDIGWVDIRAVKEYATLVGEPELINKNMKITNPNFYIYSAPYGTRGATRVRTLKAQMALTGEDVFVEQKVTTSEKEVLYKLKGLGWVGYKAISDYDTIVSRTPVNKKMKIVKDNYNIYSEVYGTRGAKRLGNLKAQVAKTGLTLEITEQVITSAGVNVYHAKNVGWIDIRSVADYDTLVSEKTVNRSLRIVKDHFYVYNLPYGTEGATRVKQLKTHVAQKGHNVVITKEATTSAKINVSYIDGLGWVDSSSVGEYATIKSTKTLNRPMTIAKQGYFIYNEPYGTKNFLRQQKLSTYVNKHGKNVYATKEVTTTDGVKVTHLRNVGWVDSRALIDSQQAKLDKVQALLNSKYSSSAYGIQVTSLSDGSSAGVNANTRFTAASTGKLPAIYYTQKKISTGQISPKKQFLYDDRINQMPNSYMRGGAGVLQGQPYGKYFALETILNWTIKYSDNQGTNFIAYHAADRYDNKMKNEISSIIGRRWDSPFSITAKENALLMAAIYRQGGQSIGYLQNTVYDDQRIPKYLPVKVAHKIGDVYDYRHDVAIVYANEPYVLSVMTKGRTYENISVLSKEIYDIMK